MQAQVSSSPSSYPDSSDCEPLLPPSTTSLLQPIAPTIDNTQNTDDSDSYKLVDLDPLLNAGVHTRTAMIVDGSTYSLSNPADLMEEALQVSTATVNTSPFTFTHLTKPIPTDANAVHNTKHAQSADENDYHPPEYMTQNPHSANGTELPPPEHMKDDSQSSENPERPQSEHDTEHSPPENNDEQSPPAVAPEPISKLLSKSILKTVHGSVRKERFHSLYRPPQIHRSQIILIK